jgi:hypothetical protein
MNIYEEINTGEIILRLSHKEAQDIVEVITAVAELKPRETTTAKIKSRARKLKAPMIIIPCY